MGMKRSDENPILTRADIPGRDVSSVFNPGAIRDGDRTRLLLRVQTRGRETLLMWAESADGVRFVVDPEPVEVEGLDDSRIYHVYDPRLTRIEDRVYVVFAADTDEGCRLGVAQVKDDGRLELVGLGPPDVRNGVLFPERLGGRFVRFERPNTGVSGDEIVLATSDDLVSWQTVAPVLSGRPHYWDERIGSGPPPIRTAEGWLHVYHGIATHPAGGDLYQAGVVLLDADDPTKVVARARENVLEPRELYEQVGQVPNVVFPSGWTFAGDEVFLYYGAADTCVGLARTTVPELLEACRGR
jgi:beta-1,4-mannooligosaccharide/beta-1,4-mannosyl-N-acetylglucosamine phosphorylase